MVRNLYWPAVSQIWNLTMRPSCLMLLNLNKDINTENQLLWWWDSFQWTCFMRTAWAENFCLPPIHQLGWVLPVDRTTLSYGRIIILLDKWYPERLTPYPHYSKYPQNSPPKNVLAMLSLQDKINQKSATLIMA